VSNQRPSEVIDPIKSLPAPQPIKPLDSVCDVGPHCAMRSILRRIRPTVKYRRICSIGSEDVVAARGNAGEAAEFAARPLPD